MKPKWLFYIGGNLVRSIFVRHVGMPYCIQIPSKIPGEFAVSISHKKIKHRKPKFSTKHSWTKKLRYMPVEYVSYCNFDLG